MKIPTGIVKVTDFENSPGVVNSWLNAVGSGVSAYLGSPAVSAYQVATQSIPTTGQTKIIFDQSDLVLDPKHSYNTTTGVFLPDVAGYYQVNATVALQNINSIQMFLNGFPWYQGDSYPTPAGGNGFLSASLSAIVPLNGATDYVDIRVSQSGSASASTTTPFAYSGRFAPVTYLGICLIRPA